MWINLVVLTVSLFTLTSVGALTMLSAQKESSFTLSQVQFQESTGIEPAVPAQSDVDSDTSYENCLQSLYQGCYNLVYACSDITTTVDAWGWLLSVAGYYYVDNGGYIRTSNYANIQNATYNPGGVMSCLDKVNYGRYLAREVKHACEGFSVDFNGIKNLTYYNELRGNLCALRSEALVKQ